MQTDGYRDVYAATSPDAFLNVPTALARVSQGDDKAFERALAAAADRDYPGRRFGSDGKQTAHESSEVFMVSSFWAGVAACWYYMNAINGQGDGGAR